MNKLNALALALLMTVSINVFADENTLPNTTNVNGTTYNAGDQGVAHQHGYKYDHDVTINGHPYPAGTEFDVVQMKDGTWVPVSTEGGGLFATGAAIGTLSTVTIVTGLVVLGGLAAFSASNNGSTTTVTQ
ncbi:MAG TPA: hypothetical protein VF296_03810 [Gallionella sp.]